MVVVVFTVFLVVVVGVFVIVIKEPVMLLLDEGEGSIYYGEPY